eukprot:2286819-Prymnesium_polylepis.1
MRPREVSTGLHRSRQQFRTTQIAQREVARSLRTSDATAEAGGSPRMKLCLRDPERDAGHASALRSCIRPRINVGTKGFHK